MIFHETKLFHWDRMKSLVYFGDLDLISRSQLDLKLPDVEPELSFNFVESVIYQNYTLILIGI